MNTFINTIFGGLVSWKTTLTGVIAAVVLLLNQLGIIAISPVEKDTIVAFALLVVGWFAKDNNKIGKPEDI